MLALLLTHTQGTGGKGGIVDDRAGRIGLVQRQERWRELPGRGLRSHVLCVVAGLLRVELASRSQGMRRQGQQAGRQPRGRQRSAPTGADGPCLGRDHAISPGSAPCHAARPGLAGMPKNERKNISGRGGARDRVSTGLAIESGRSGRIGNTGPAIQNQRARGRGRRPLCQASLHGKDYLNVNFSSDGERAAQSRPASVPAVAGRDLGRGRRGPVRGRAGAALRSVSGPAACPCGPRLLPAGPGRWRRKSAWCGGRERGRSPGRARRRCRLRAAGVARRRRCRWPGR